MSKIHPNVTIVPEGDAIAVWAHTGTSIDSDTAATMTVVDASFGRTATPDLSAPWTGVGKGHVRPFIGTHPITCRACQTEMTASAFPTRSVPKSDPDPKDPNRGTRGDLCRACNKSGLRTHAAYVAAGSPERTKHAVPATVTEVPAKSKKAKSA